MISPRYSPYSPGHADGGQSGHPTKVDRPLWDGKNPEHFSLTTVSRVPAGSIPGPHPDNPEVVEGPYGARLVTWVELCSGDAACPGTLVEHTGINGSLASEVLCPYHQERWYNWARDKVGDWLWSQSNIPTGYAGWTLDTCPARESAAWLQGGLAKHNGRLPRGFMLWGESGTCKSGLLLGAAYELMYSYGVGVYFTLAEAAMSALRPGEFREDGAVHRMLDAEVLVLDDLTKSLSTTYGASDFVQRSLFHMLEVRISNQRPTFISANLVELSDLYALLVDQALVERILSTDNFIHLEMAGETYRPLVAPKEES